MPPDPLRIGTAMSGTDAAGGSGIGWAASHGQITEAPDGTLLAPVYGKLPSDATFFRLSVVRSVDGGLSWPAANEVGERRLTVAAVVERPSQPWRVAATSPVLDILVDDQANPSVVEIEPGRVLVSGFGYTARSLVATYVDVASVRARTDLR